MSPIRTQVAGGSSVSATGGWPAPSGGDDSSRINGWIDAAYLIGGDVHLGPGTWRGQQIRLRTGVFVDMHWSTLKLNDGANTDLVTTENFATLTGTSSQVGQPSHYGLRNGFLDGNKANNSSGRCLATYGRAFFFENFYLQNAAGVGWLSEGQGGSDMEARVSHFKVMACDGGGITWNGPHDSVVTDGIVERNGDTSGGQYGVAVLAAGGAGTIFTDVHVWSGATDWSWYLTRAAKLYNCQGEGAVVGQLFIGGAYTEVRGGAYFNPSRTTSGPAIVLGEAALRYVSQSIIDTVIRDHKVPFHFANDSGWNWIRLQIEFPFNTLADGAITSADATLTSATAAFVAGDVGKSVTVAGAGVAGALLTTTIASINSATSVELTATASTTVTGAAVTYGWDQPPYTGSPFDSTRVEILSSGPGANSHERNGYMFVPSTVAIAKSSTTAFTIAGTTTTRVTVDTSGTPAKGMVYLRQKSGDTGNILTVSDGSDVDKLGVNGTGVLIGTGTAITKHLSATATWDPASTADAAMASTTVTVTGAAIGDTVAVGFSIAVPAGALLVGAVTATNTVTVTLFNKTGGVLDLASGTLRADVWQH